jgi:xanthine dehydrogenase iron-sulfur cluster and FAD-binding subunit A
MLLTAAALLERDPAPTRAITREFISGNFCRCTGYQAIVDAVQDAARRMAGAVDNPATGKLLADSSAIDDPAAANP